MAEPGKARERPGERALLSILDVVSDQVASTITTYEVNRRVNNIHAVDPSDPGLIEPLAN